MPTAGDAYCQNGRLESSPSPPSLPDLLVDYLVDMAAKTGTIQWRTPGTIRDKKSRYLLRCNRLQVFSQTARDTPHGGSTPPASTRRVLHEHLLFSRWLRRDGVVLVPTMRKSGQGFTPWPLFCYILSPYGSALM